MALPVQLDRLLNPLHRLARGSDHLVASPARAGEATDAFELPRYVFLGPGGGGDPVRIGFFAGIHGDEVAGIEALIRLAGRLEAEPSLAQGYQLYFYPVCNPSGVAAGTRHSASGKDLNREFWRESGEPEVRLLEAEIRHHGFQGLVSLHADDTSDGIYGYVRGAVLTRALLEPALEAAGRILQLNRAPVIDGFPAENGIISECFDGILTSPPQLHPAPFEIILETPQGAVLERQTEALVAGLLVILVEYRKFIAFAPNL